MIPPSGRVPEQGPDWFLVATEACGGGTPDLGYFLEVWGFIGDVGIENKSGAPRRAHEAHGRAPGGWARPPPSWATRESPGPTLLLRGLLLVQKNHQKLARQLDSVWYSFSVKLKNKEKNRNWHWALG